MNTTDRDESRRVFVIAWQKYLDKQPLEPLEHQIVEIILLHPEYHTLFSHPDAIHYDSPDEVNPFLHISLHLGLLEQLSTNRPLGIQSIYQALCTKYNDPHQAEHKMITCLAETLWEAQRNNVMPDERIYLERLMKL